MAGSVPEQAGFTQSSSRSHHGLVPSDRTAARIQRDQIIFGQGSDAPRAGFEVVDQERGRKVNLLGKDGLLNDPGEIGSFNTTVANGTCNSKTRRFRPRTGLIQKTGYDLAEFPMFPA